MLAELKHQRSTVRKAIVQKLNRTNGQMCCLSFVLDFFGYFFYQEKK
jgi:hypothetical protein